MCDLIDFDSPEGKSKGSSSSSLALPLIPAPNNSCAEIQSSGDFIGERRKSFDNNPFDVMLEETAEYTRKKADPFERVMEKAFRSNSMDNHIKKRTGTSDALRRNKTHNGSYTFDHRSCEKREMDKPKPNEFSTIQGNPPDIDISPPSPPSPSTADLSILNHSTMDDSLLEDNQKKGDPNFSIRQHSVTSEYQLLSPRIQSRRSKSVTDAKYNSSGLSMPSFISEDPMNVGFRKPSSGSSGITDFSIGSAYWEKPIGSTSSISQISDISSVPRIPSVSSVDSSGSMSVFSNGSMNQAFIGSTNSLTASKRPNIADLTKKFVELKTRMSHSMVQQDTPNELMLSEKATISRCKSENDTKSSDEKPLEKEDSKLIDIDVFMLDITSNSISAQNANSRSDCSLESVFAVSCFR